MAEHSIENNVFKITVSDSGAELVSVKDKKTGAERMWSADPTVWNRHAPVLFPFVGKVYEGIYHIDGKAYEMKTQHGFARDMVFELVSITDNSITHILRANEDTKKKYPYDFEFYVTHRIDDNEAIVYVNYEIINNSKDDMYYTVGAHPGFAVEADAQREDYKIYVEGKEKLEYILLNNSGYAIPDKKYELILDKGEYAITKDMFDKDALVFENNQIEKISLIKKDNKPYVTLECHGFPYFGVWSKIDGRFVCLEPWTGRTDNDGFTGDIKDKNGISNLPAGENKIYSYSIQFH